MADKNYLDKEPVFELLRVTLRNHLSNLTIKYQTDENIVNRLADISWIGRQENLSTIWGNTKRIMDFLTADETKNDTRIDFLLKTTSLLKFTLGRYHWELLLDDLSGSMRMWDKGNDGESLLSRINRLNILPDEQFMRENHWIVVVILYGLMSDTGLIIENYLIELDTSIRTSQSKQPTTTNRILREV